MINSYLKKHAYIEAQLKEHSDPELNMVIVIPARVEPDLRLTLESIYNADKPDRPFEIIIVFNHPEDENEELKKLNEELFIQCKDWIYERKLSNCHLIKVFDLNKKHAGVGLARKIGMDEAVFRLGHNEEGIIVALDADCSVEANYLKCIEDRFTLDKKVNAASIYFEHQLSDKDEYLNEGIIQYELHLRYYNQLLRYAGHPFAYHTVGSSMAVRSRIYQQQGGMNKRKAGEDFYFLQKVIQTGGFTEINSTCVYPSARVSDRVPFGTGRAQGEWLKEKSKILFSYHPKAGLALKIFFSIIENTDERPIDTKSVPKSILLFIGKDILEDKLSELVENTASNSQFLLRFYKWFNLFMCFKFVHFYRDNVESNIPINNGAMLLLEILELDFAKNSSSLELLNLYRKLDKKTG